MKHILFVCRANICRSPIAEGIARKIAKESSLDLAIDSAGTINRYENELPCSSSLKISALNGIDISQIRARQVKTNDAEVFEHVVAMDNENVRDLQALGFKNVHLLGDFGGYGGINIPDPYFLKDFDEDIRDIYNVYTIIDTCIKDFISTVANQ